MDQTTLTTISLSLVLPEIASLLPSGERGPRALTLPVLDTEGDLGDLLARVPNAFDFIVVDGIVFKQTRYLSRDALELFGPGDLLAPPLSASRQLDLRAISTYRAHGQAQLAVIADRFRAAARRWPELSDVLHDRLARQTHRTSMQLAALHLTRAEDRVLALFNDLGERFGRVTPDGVLIDINLTHELIGQLIASRRPTVSLALEHLAAHQQLTRLDDGRWQLNPTTILAR